MSLEDVMSIVGYISTICTAIAGISTALARIFPKATFFALLARLAGIVGVDLHKLTGGRKAEVKAQAARATT